MIDLFAGPGGLGEGFSSIDDSDGNQVFRIRLSIEKDEYAHRTLLLRAFFRGFRRGGVPSDYYDYLAGKVTRDTLFEKHRDAADMAAAEAWLAELGAASTPNNEVDDRIRTAIEGRTNWVLIGGPPCQAYSLVGRSRLIGAGKNGRIEGSGSLASEALLAQYSKRQQYEADPRHKLYRHYLRILAVHRPPVFVMENVKGLLSATLKEERTFERIMADLKAPSAAMPEAGVSDVRYRLIPLATRDPDLLAEYQPRDFVVRAERHGVPQARHRVIIVGVRTDIDCAPAVLVPTPPMSVAEAIGNLPRLRSGLSKEADSTSAWRDAVLAAENAGWMADESIADDVRRALTAAVRTVGANLGRGDEFVTCKPRVGRNPDWFLDRRMTGVCNHESRGHIRADLHRYFFASVFAQQRKRSPLLGDFPRALLPAHDNVDAALKQTKFNDRFRVQLADRPSTTVVSHIAKDGHYYIHYDPSQCRSLTVREAARLQTFPDNYRFEGPRTEQYKQVGNAVPPFLARQIAKTILGMLL